MINSERIKDRMRTLDLTQKDVAECLCIATPTACQKINGVRPMDLDEARKLANLLKLEEKDFCSYFFCGAIA